MKKTTFAKLFEFPLHQVLVTKAVEDDEIGMNIQSQLFGKEFVTIRYKFKDMKALNKAFDEYTQEKADQYLKNAIKMFNS